MWISFQPSDDYMQSLSEQKQQTKCDCWYVQVGVSSNTNFSHTLCPIFSYQMGGEFSAESPEAGSPHFWGLSFMVHFLSFQGQSQLLSLPHFPLISPGS